MALVEMSGREIEVVRYALQNVANPEKVGEPIEHRRRAIAWDLDWRLASAK